MPNATPLRVSPCRSASGRALRRGACPEDLFADAVFPLFRAGDAGPGHRTGPPPPLPTEPLRPRVRCTRGDDVRRK